VIWLARYGLFKEKIHEIYDHVNPLSYCFLQVLLNLRCVRKRNKGRKSIMMFYVIFE